MADRGAQHRELLEQLTTRRSFLARASAIGAGALAAVALPPLPARAAGPTIGTPLTDATLQAFADTIIPGRRVSRTESGAAVDPRAILGVDDLPGAVEADVLILYDEESVGFPALAPQFLADLQSRSLTIGAGDFIDLPWEKRVAVCLSGLDFQNPSRLVWEAAAAFPFIAFCAAGLVPGATWKTAVGYRVMGLPGAAPNGYSGYSYRRRLARERTVDGSLP